MIILFRLFSVVSLFIFIVMLFSYFSAICLYAELIPNTNHNFSNLKDFKNNSLQYANFDKGVRIQYPSDWTKVEAEQGSYFATFVLPRESISERYQGSIGLRSMDLPNPNMKIPEALDYSIRTQSSLAEFNLINKMTNLTIAQGRPAFGMNYTYYDSNAQTTLNAMGIGTIADNKIYSISYFAEPSKFNTNLPTVQKLIESFQIFELVPYENLDKGVRIQYPSDWTKVEDETSISFVQFYAPDRQIIWLGNTELPKGNTTLNDYLEYLTNFYNQTNGTMKFVVTKTDSGSLTLGGHPAYTIDFTSTTDTSIIKVTETGIISDGKVYSIKYFAEPSKFNAHLPTVQKMIDSFKFFTLEFFEDIQNGLQISFPSTWTKKKLDNGITFYTSENLFPKDNLTISSYDITNPLDSIIHKKKNTYTKNLNYEYIGQSNYNFTTTLDNIMNASQLSFKKSIPNKFNISATEIIIEFKHKVYSITFQTKENRYDLNSIPQIVNDIISNFRIIEFVDYNTKDEFKHSKHQLLSQIEYPKIWDFIPVGVGFQIYSPFENDLDNYREYLYTSIGSSPVNSIEDLASNYINNIKGKLTNFQLLNSTETTLLNNSAHKIIFTFKDDQSSCQCDLKVMSIITKIDSKAYFVEYSAELDKFSSYLRIIQTIINSLKIQEKATVDVIKAGLRLNGSPEDLAINPNTNKVYVAIPETREIQVIDGFTDQVIQKISIGAFPGTIVLNPTTNKIYVASPETDIIYVIDGLTNKITGKIEAGPFVGDMALDTNEFGGLSALLFVTNQGNDSISIIDDAKGKVVSNIKTRTSPFGIGVDTIKNRAYITTNLGVDIIDYNTNLERNVTGTYHDNIVVGYIPTGIIVNSNTSRAYITNSASNTVSVIDTMSNEPLYEIGVGLFPYSIAFNPINKMIYVSNTGTNTVSLINSTIKKELINSTIGVSEIPIDSIAYDVAVNPKTNMVYLANSESQTISTMNVNKLVSAIIFHVYPSDAGYIVCNKNKVPVNSYHRIMIDTQCKAIANSGFVFSSWSDKPPSSHFHGIAENQTFYESLSTFIRSIFGDSSNSHEDSFTVSKYETRTANYLSISSTIQNASPYLSIGTLLSVIFLATIKPPFHIQRKIREDDNKRVKDLQTTIASFLPTVYKSEIEKKDNQRTKDEDDNVLSMGEVLTIDATVIIGVLIFLTFTEGFEPSEQYQINIITASIVFPFAISAVMGVTNKKKIATRLMIAGFINLMISVILIAIMKI